MAATAVPERPAAPVPAGPAGRDLTVDLLRAVAMVLVATGHWLVVVPRYGNGRFGGVNALETVPLMRGLTWVFQVMPLFFAIGGYAGAASWASPARRGGGQARPLPAAQAYAGWLRARLHRLLAPTVVLLGGWTAVCAALRLAGVDAGLVQAVGGLVVVPVWFLSVYVVLTALVPVSVAAHRRFGAGAPVALLAAAAVVDAVRLGGGPGPVAHVNFLLVYGFAQQLGLWWRDGRVHRPTLVAAAGAGALWLLTHAGPYPVSLVGVPGEAVANNAPPTLCLAALGVAQVGLAVRARPALEGLLTRRPVRVAAVVLNGNAMTVLLWHFTALALGALVVLPLGIVPTYADGTGAWWLVRLATVAGLAPVLALLVAGAGRVERRAARRPAVPDDRAVSAGRLLAAVAALAAGFAVVAGHGLSEPDTLLGLPLAALVLVGGGTALVGRRP